MKADTVPLVEVGDRYEIPGLGLVLHPGLDLPDNFTPVERDVELALPGNATLLRRASFAPAHLRLTSGFSDYRLEIILIDTEKADIPVGTVVSVDRAAVESVGISPRSRTSNDAR